MKNGQAFLGLILIIGGVAVVVGLTLALSSGAFVDTGYGYRASVQADAVATAGAQDGLLLLQRNASLASSYSLPVGSTTASVAITQNSPSAGYANILSTATISNHTRKINVIAAVNATTSQVSVISWQDIQ